MQNLTLIQKNVDLVSFMFVDDSIHSDKFVTFFACSKNHH